MTIFERLYGVSACAMKGQGQMIQKIHFYITQNINKNVLHTLLMTDQTQELISAEDSRVS